MSRAGVLVHAYYLQPGWEEIAWGLPEKGIMGSLPKLVQLLLSTEDTVSDIIMYTGPSHKDELNESEFSKQFLLNHFDQLIGFPQLEQYMSKLTNEQLEVLRNTISERFIPMGQLVNSAAEIRYAAAYFQEKRITKIYQIAIASHIPRCISLQTIARHNHQIPPEQFWLTIAADTTYNGTAPDDVVIVEPPHRGDDPARGIHPSITDILKHYYQLPYEARQPFLHAVDATFDSFPNPQ